MRISWLLIKTILTLVNPFISTSVLRAKLPKRYTASQIKGHLFLLECYQALDFSGESVSADFLAGENLIISINKKGLDMLEKLEEIEKRGTRLGALRKSPFMK